MKKTAKKAATTRKGNKATSLLHPLVLTAIIAVASVGVGPLLWWYFNNVTFLFAVPALVSFVIAFMYKDLVGEVMSASFRNETTVIVAVLAVIVSAIITVRMPMVGLDGVPGTTLPVFLIFFRSVWGLTTALLTVYLPLGVTLPKKK